MEEIGEALKNEREKKKKSLKYIAKRTNISLNSLNALENNQFNKIPGGFYLKNYIKNYLKALDVDGDEFFKIHQEEINSILINVSVKKKLHTAKIKYSRFKKKNVFFYYLMAIILFSVTVLFLYTNKEKILNIEASGNGNQKIPDTDINIIISNLKDKFNLDYSPLNVSIEFFDQCWTQIYRGGKKVIEKIYKSGEDLSIKGYALEINVGNPSRIKLLLNGKEVVYLRKLTKPEKLTINPTNLNRIYEK